MEIRNNNSTHGIQTSIVCKAKKGTGSLLYFHGAIAAIAVRTWPASGRAGMRLQWSGFLCSRHYGLGLPLASAEVPRLPSPLVGATGTSVPWTQERQRLKAAGDNILLDLQEGLVSREFLPPGGRVTSPQSAISTLVVSHPIRNIRWCPSPQAQVSDFEHVQVGTSPEDTF